MSGLKAVKSAVKKLVKLDAPKNYFYNFDPSTLKDYFKYVQKPMNFEKVLSNIDRGFYKTPKEAVEDVYLIFQNALKYQLTDPVVKQSAKVFLNWASSLKRRVLKNKAATWKDLALNIVTDLELDHIDKTQWFLAPGVGMTPENTKIYKQVIKRPMDFGTVKKNLKENKYADIKAFAADMRRVTDNCKRFNWESTHFVQLAEDVSQEFEKALLTAEKKFAKAKKAAVSKKKPKSVAPMRRVGGPHSHGKVQGDQPCDAREMQLKVLLAELSKSSDSSILRKGLQTITKNLESGQYFYVSNFIAAVQDLPEATESGQNVSGVFESNFNKLLGKYGLLDIKKAMYPQKSIHDTKLEKAKTNLPTTQQNTLRPLSSQVVGGSSKGGASASSSAGGMGDGARLVVVKPATKKRPSIGKFEDAELDLERAKGLMDELSNESAYKYFLLPVNEVRDNAPFYYQRIKNPCDFSTIRQRLKQHEAGGEYYHSNNAFKRDLIQIVENAKLYNARNHHIFQCASKLENKVVKWFRKVGPEWRKEKLTKLGFPPAQQSGSSVKNKKIPKPKKAKRPSAWAPPPEKMVSSSHAEAIIKNLLANPLSIFFRVPVDEKRDGALGYYAKIKQPMDLSKSLRIVQGHEAPPASVGDAIKFAVVSESGDRQVSAKMVMDVVNLIWSNCVAFNGSKAAITQHAKRLKKIFVTDLKRLVDDGILPKPPAPIPHAISHPTEGSRKPHPVPGKPNVVAPLATKPSTKPLSGDVKAPIQVSVSPPKSLKTNHVSTDKKPTRPSTLPASKPTPIPKPAAPMTVETKTPSPALRAAWVAEAEWVLNMLDRYQVAGKHLSSDFSFPIDPVVHGLPKYDAIIERRMDLGTVRANLAAQKYPNFEEFAADTQMVFKNCTKYYKKIDDRDNLINIGAYLLRNELSLLLKTSRERLYRRENREVATPPWVIKAQDVVQHCITYFPGFKLPVNPAAFDMKHYFKIIKHPMDLGTMERMLSAGLYDRTVDGETEFLKDINRVWQNTEKYWSEENRSYWPENAGKQFVDGVLKNAKDLETMFNKRYRGIKPKPKKPAPPKPIPSALPQSTPFDGLDLMGTGGDEKVHHLHHPVKEKKKKEKRAGSARPSKVVHASPAKSIPRGGSSRPASLPRRDRYSHPSPKRSHHNHASLTNETPDQKLLSSMPEFLRKRCPFNISVDAKLGKRKNSSKRKVALQYDINHWSTFLSKNGHERSSLVLPPQNYKIHQMVSGPLGHDSSSSHDESRGSRIGRQAASSHANGHSSTGTTAVSNRRSDTKSIGVMRWQRRRKRRRPHATFMAYGAEPEDNSDDTKAQKAMKQIASAMERLRQKRHKVDSDSLAEDTPGPTWDIRCPWLVSDSLGHSPSEVLLSLGFDQVPHRLDPSSAVWVRMICKRLGTIDLDGNRDHPLQIDHTVIMLLCTKRSHESALAQNTPIWPKLEQLHAGIAPKGRPSSCTASLILGSVCREQPGTAARSHERMRQLRSELLAAEVSLEADRDGTVAFSTAALSLSGIGSLVESLKGAGLKPNQLKWHPRGFYYDVDSLGSCSGLMDWRRLGSRLEHKLSEVVKENVRYRLGDLIMPMGCALPCAAVHVVHPAQRDFAVEVENERFVVDPCGGRHLVRQSVPAALTLQAAIRGHLPSITQQQGEDMDVESGLVGNKSPTRTGSGS